MEVFNVFLGVAMEIWGEGRGKKSNLGKIHLTRHPNPGISSLKMYTIFRQFECHLMFPWKVRRETSVTHISKEGFKALGRIQSG